MLTFVALPIITVCVYVYLLLTEFDHVVNNAIGAWMLMYVVTSACTAFMFYAAVYPGM